MTTQSVIILVVAYLLGSIPSAYIATRLVLGKDIRQLGDGNMGAKNTFHSVGTVVGTMVAAADIGKGALAVIIAQRFSTSDAIVMLAGALAVAGHDFPIYLGFKGGQGMAAMGGVFLVLFPQQLLLAVGALLIALLATRNWDWSCAVGFVLLVILIWVGDIPTKYLLYTVLLLPSLAVTKLLVGWRARRMAIVANAESRPE
ncbi:MAG: glycerol-3-phosphate acyltransferase [Anaerolineales bacterium]|jgi:glycerol-3-phosphate acyltransferase PlsY